MSAIIDLDAVIEKANRDGEGIWDLAYEVKPTDEGYADVWVYDFNEAVTSENMHDALFSNLVVKPIEDAVRAATGAGDFYLDAFDYAGRFVGSVFAGDL